MTPTRRSLLLGAALLPVAACSGSGRRERPGPVDPDVALRAQAVARERALLASYDALLAAEPGLSARLAPLRAEHVEHLTALGEQEQAPTGSPGPGSSPGLSGGLPALVAAERDTARAHAEATVPASSALAAVLAQLAASEASHPVALA